MKEKARQVEKECFLDERSMTDVFSSYFKGKMIMHFVANKQLFRVVDGDLERSIE